MDLSKTSLSKWIKVGLKRSMKIENFEANQILTLVYFDCIEKCSGLSQSDLIFMHLLIVSRTSERAGNPKKIDWAKSPLGQRFDRQLYPACGEIDNPSLTLMIHFWQRNIVVIVVLCCVFVLRLQFFTKCYIDDSVLIHAKYIYL